MRGQPFSVALVGLVMRAPLIASWGDLFRTVSDCFGFVVTCVSVSPGPLGPRHLSGQFETANCFGSFRNTSRRIDD